MCLSAVLRKTRTFDDGSLVIGRVLPTRKRRDQRAQTDACRTEVRHLVEFYHRVDALVRLKDFAHLGCRECVQTAAEGTQLNHRHVRVLRDKLRRVVEARVIAPLVDNLKPPLVHGDVIDRILGENRQFVGLDHLRDAVVDLGVDVVRTTCEKNRVLTRLGNAVEDLLPVVTHVLPIFFDLGIARIDGSRDLLLSNSFRPAELLHEALDHALPVIDRQKRLDQSDIFLAQDVHVDADVLRIGRDDRTVEVICRGSWLVLHVLRLAGIENRVDPLLYEIDNMPVRELRRIAERVRRNRCHAFVEKLR